MTAYAKIAISLPPDDLAAADRLARAQDRSRSWIVAEAIRRYVAEQERESVHALGSSRAAQVKRDLALTATERIREADELGVLSVASSRPIEQPRTFQTYDAFAKWRRRGRT
ncbi:MAG: ribbon-helix-helix protein, CopG family [Gemmatimonadaceae bacterium]|nr:ribbon-helix-helix protein, CopG family [Gemmatimonadaceae bacterium]